MRNLFTSILNDFKLLLSKKGLTEIVKAKQDKHIYVSDIIVTYIFPFFIFFNKWIVDRVDSILFGIFISGLIAWGFNFANEVKQDRDYKIRTNDMKGIFDWRDVRMGFYSGLFKGFVIILAFKYLIWFR